MAIPKARDPEVTRSRLRDWLAGRLDGATEVEIPMLNMPKSTGFSSETLLFDASWNEGPAGAHGRVERQLVGRVAPTGYSIFHEYDLDRQRRVMDTLSTHSDVPVPTIYWHEPAETSPFDKPFFVMDRIDGITPPDEPPYARKGWLFDASPADQARLWYSGVDVLARIHALDWEALDLGFLARPGGAQPGMAPELDYAEDYLKWTVEDRDFPLLTDALAWLRANIPAEPRITLSWGDARFGNMLFQDFTPVAVLDWEMAALAPPESDLAWWTVFDQTWSQGWGFPQLPGFLDREGTIALYEELSGHAVTSFHYYEVWAAFRLAIIFLRFTDMLVANGQFSPGGPNPPSKPSWTLLAELLPT